MILRARQWRQEEKFEYVERHFLLDDFNVAPRRFRRVIGKAQYVAGIGPDANGLPSQQHIAVFRNFVLPFLGGKKIVRINVLQPNEDAGNAGSLGLGNKIRDLVAEGVCLAEGATVTSSRMRQVCD